ncbi:MAG TPA: UDP-N-acetylmuramoyl-tripeptide--D-alanyl-D-alanine ligase, partial [Thermosynechococcaceae cyanobacterium]
APVPFYSTMTCRATLAQLTDLLSATPHNLANPHAPFHGITTDTRSLKPGQIYLALRGENFDGHQFVAAAIAQGAVAAIVDTPVGSDLPLLQVAHTLQSYQAIAHWWRNQFTIPVIAITGSVGKTTTKELIAAVLAHTGAAVLKTQANYNNEIGVPKTLLELDAHHAFAVIEMGMRGRGEIALLSQIARPDIAVITNVGTAHIGRLGSEQAIAEAKCELLSEMPRSSTAILNHDNERLRKTAATVWQGKTLTYGLEGGDLHGEFSVPDRLKLSGLELTVPLPGEHNALNYLAALAVAQSLGIDWASLSQGLTIELPAGRARRDELPQDVVILDETYNAGLESMLAALQLLSQTPGKRHIAILGTMKELGDRSLEFHRQVGEQTKALALDHLLILAETAEAEALALGADPLVSECFTDPTAVVDRLQALVQPGDRLLFKASRAVGLDRVVHEFRSRYLSHPYPLHQYPSHNADVAEKT